MKKTVIYKGRRITLTDFRNLKEYTTCMDKIKKYTKGFEFTLNYAQIPTPQANALMIIMADAKKEGLIESIAIGLSLEGIVTDETFRKL